MNNLALNVQRLIRRIRISHLQNTIPSREWYAARWAYVDGERETRRRHEEISHDKKTLDRLLEESKGDY